MSLLTLLALLLLGLPSTLAAQDSTPPRPAASDSVDVPSLIGLDRISAVFALGGARLGAHVRTGVSSGHVIRQEPAAGTRVPRGTRVSLWLGRQRTAPAPSSAAVKADTAKHPPAPASPPPAAEHAAPVETADSVVVPDLISYAVPRAMDALAAAGLRLGKRRTGLIAVDSIPRIIDQQPRPGAKVRAGSSVDVVTSRPKH
ncbi:MAG: PASTA domain-containing protein [Gemmatimonadota bacterium]